VANSSQLQPSSIMGASKEKQKHQGK